MAAVVAIGFVAGLVFAAEKLETAAKAEKKEPAKISVRKLEAQTVLYTVYRGPYDQIGKAIGELYGLAGKNQIIPRGAVTLVYLNSPAFVLPEHYLTEIRIPVGDEAKKLAGTLGVMTDVKNLRPMEVAVVEKASGDMDYTGIYSRLYGWIAKNGYSTADNMTEVFQSTGGGSFEQMKSELMLPVNNVTAKAK